MEEKKRDWKDPGLYRKLREPFVDADAAQLAWERFTDGVIALRAEHGIPELYVIGQYNYTTQEGEEARFGATLGLGDRMNHEAMLAAALNSVQRDRQEFIGAILASNVTKTNRKHER